MSGHTETNLVGTEPLIFLGRKYIRVNIISGKVCEYDFKKCLLLNLYSVKIYRNLRCIVLNSVADCPNYGAFCDAIEWVIRQICKIKNRVRRVSIVEKN